MLRTRHRRGAAYVFLAGLALFAADRARPLEAQASRPTDLVAPDDCRSRPETG